MTGTPRKVLLMTAPSLDETTTLQRADNMLTREMQPARMVGDALVTVDRIWMSSTPGWLLAVANANGHAHLCVSDNEADALLTLLLTRMYQVSEADVEIALTTLASLGSDQESEVSRAGEVPGGVGE